MLRAVLDTNVLVSSLLALGKPRELLTRILRREMALVISKEILNEFMRVMRRKRFSEYATEEQVRRFVENVKKSAELVMLKNDLKVIDEDPKDDIVINTALDGSADLIISEDHHLLSLREFKDIKIVSVDEALRILKKGSRACKP